jgi:hypothetical protein
MDNSADKPLPTADATKPSVNKLADSPLTTTKDKGNVRLGATAHILPPTSKTADASKVRLGATAHLFPRT